MENLINTNRGFFVTDVLEHIAGEGQVLHYDILLYKRIDYIKNSTKCNNARLDPPHPPQLKIKKKPTLCEYYARNDNIILGDCHAPDGRSQWA